MKKSLAIMVTLLIVIPTFMAFAEEANDPMAVTLISGPEEEEAEQVSLDDVQTDKEIEIEEFGNVTFTSFEYKDWFDRYYDDKATSGEEAEFACLFLDVLNTTTKEKDYYANIDVKAVYDTDYEYAGWAFQIDYDRSKDVYIKHDCEYMFPISPMYTGHYVVGATLPNAVINGKGELKLIITMDGNEMTYYIRKE